MISKFVTSKTSHIESRSFLFASGKSEDTTTIIRFSERMNYVWRSAFPDTVKIQRAFKITLSLAPFPYRGRDFRILPHLAMSGDLSASSADIAEKGSRLQLKKLRGPSHNFISILCRALSYFSRTQTSYRFYLYADQTASPIPARDFVVARFSCRIHMYAVSQNYVAIFLSLPLFFSFFFFQTIFQRICRATLFLATVSWTEFYRLSISFPQAFDVLLQTLFGIMRKLYEGNRGF